MKTGKKIFCRMNHKFINSLMPILPYRQPDCLAGAEEAVKLIFDNLEKLYYFVYEENTNEQ